MACKIYTVDIYMYKTCFLVKGEQLVHKKHTVCSPAACMSHIHTTTCKKTWEFSYS